MSFIPFHPSARPRAAWLLLLLPVLTCPREGLGSDQPTLNILDAMRLAVREAPSVLAEAALSQAAREDAERAAALPDPVLSLALDNLPVQGADALHVGADLMTMRRIGLSQEWPSRPKRDARRALADTTVQVSVASEASTRLQVERQAALAWLQRWRAESRLTLLDTLDREAVRAADLAEARLRGGAGSAIDALNARTAVVELASRRIAAEADRDAAMAALARWIPQAAERPLAAIADFDQLAVPAEQLRGALDRHAPVALAAARSAQAERGIALAEAGKRPDLRFGASYAARSGRDDMLMLEVGIGLPLFRRDRQDRDVAARRAEFAAAEAMLEDAQRAERERLERMLAAWAGLQRHVEHTREGLLPLANDRSELALASYAGGGELQPWLDARLAEIELQLNYIDSRAALGAQWVALATLLPDTQR